jgi:integrase
VRGHVSAYETKSGRRWRIIYEAPPAFDPATGQVKRRQAQRRGFRTEREAQRALRQALTAVEEAAHVDHRTETMGAYLRSWLEGLTVRETTAAQYRQQVELRVLPYPIAAKRLQDVRVEDLDQLYRLLEREGGRGGRPLSPKSVRHTHGALRKALGDAKRRGYVVRNVAEDATPPAPKRPELEVWTAGQLRTFLASVEDDRLYALWLLLATTGMRRGEALGLRWDDVDLDAGTVTVRRNRTLVRGRVVVQDTKTDQGRRRIALDPETAGALRRHRVRQLEERMAASSAWQDTGALFVREDGAEPHPNRVSRWFGDHATAAGLPTIRLHDLRHTYATVALSSGEPITVVSRRLGHATVSITLDVYSHVLPTDDRDTASRVATAILGG